MNHKETLWSRLDSPEASLGVSCDADGPSIGPIRLLKRSANGLELRQSDELDFVLSHALGYPTNLTSKIEGLKSVVRALDQGDLAKAKLITQFMWLPCLSDEAAHSRAIKADVIAKAGFNSAQPRDDHGLWSRDGSARGRPSHNLIPVQGVMVEPVIPFLEQILPPKPFPINPGFPSDVIPPVTGTPDIAVPRSGTRDRSDDPGCSQEWETAQKYCDDLDRKGLLGIGDYKEHGRYYEQCVRGQVSERCGGNPVDRTPRGPKRPYGGRASDIIA